MSSAVLDREVFTAKFDVLDTALEDVLGLDSEMLCTPERLALLERYEKVRRRLSAGEHPLIKQLQQEATPEELGGKLSHAIADWTLISRAEAARRVGFRSCFHFELIVPHVRHHHIRVQIDWDADAAA
jgi:hypothetical protein